MGLVTMCSCDFANDHACGAIDDRYPNVFEGVVVEVMKMGFQDVLDRGVSGHGEDGHLRKYQIDVGITHLHERWAGVVACEGCPKCSLVEE